MITIVKADDWMAVYGDNGECLYQNHSIDDEDLLRFAGVEHQVIWAQDQADEAGDFPLFLTDVRPDDETG